MHLSFAASENISRRLKSCTQPMKQDGTENDLSRARAGLCLRTVSQEQTQVQPGTLHQCFSKVNKKHGSFAKCLAQLEDMNGVRHAQDLTWMW